MLQVGDGRIAAPTRRSVLRLGLAAAGALCVPSALPAMPGRGPSRARAEALAAQMAAQDDMPAALPARPRSPSVIRPALLDAALGSLRRHGGSIRNRDRMVIVDFERDSSTPRLHCLNLEDGSVDNLLVAHGSGSDPAHTGYLQRFSNEVDSNASCQGAFATADYYVGKHGRSQRLLGLDPTNDNARARAIVIHGAWYANPDMIATHGKLGRSQGCFAVGEAALDRLFDHLGSGRMIYAAKIA